MRDRLLHHAYCKDGANSAAHALRMVCGKFVSCACVCIFIQDLAGEGDRLALEIQRRMVEVSSLFLPVPGSGGFLHEPCFLTCLLPLAISFPTQFGGRTPSLAIALRRNFWRVPYAATN